MKSSTFNYRDSKIKLKILNFGCLILLILLMSCSKDDQPELVKPLAIGDFYEGGIIFYISTLGDYGIVCAVSDQSNEVDWGCEGIEILGADGTTVGSGKQNTIDILAGCASSGIAADLCANITLNGFDDWYLPSYDQITEMNKNKEVINAKAIVNGGTTFNTTDYYWSSTENNAASSFRMSFDDGFIGQCSKSTTHHVRAVRSFSIIEVKP